MPRQARIEYPGAHYHVMCRGNNGQEIFLSDDGRRLFLATLTEACEQAGWRIHAYCLMSNHYHLSLETPEANLVAGMKWFQGAYTQRFNAMFLRRGHLYQGRYKAIPVHTDPRTGGREYFRQLSSYIHLNPYRAGICGGGQRNSLESYAWSSYPAYCGLVRKRPGWLVRKKVLKTWGLREGEAGCLADYRSKLERVMAFEEDPAAGWRGEFEQQVKRGWYIGSKEFRERLLERLDNVGSGVNLRGGQKREHNERMAERLLASGLHELGLSESQLLGLKSCAPEKQAVAWLLKTRTTVTGVWLAARLNLGHPSNVSRSLRTFRENESKTTQNLKQKMTQCIA